MAGIKPRWNAWESICLRKAFEEKIQLKIIALALGRTMESISKKINKLGLRGVKSAPGRVKGAKNDRPFVEKTPLDREKMCLIIRTYAPIKLSQKGELALKEGYWASLSASLQGKKQGSLTNSAVKKSMSFSDSFPLEYILYKDSMPIQMRHEKILGGPCYVSLQHVEQWAATKGFHQLGYSLKQHGLTYWKGGKYFSKAQLLIYVNRIRHERKLQPLTFYEDEDILYS